MVTRSRFSREGDGALPDLQEPRATRPTRYRTQRGFLVVIRIRYHSGAGWYPARDPEGTPATGAYLRCTGFQAVANLPQVVNLMPLVFSFEERNRIPHIRFRSVWSGLCAWETWHRVPRFPVD